MTRILLLVVLVCCGWFAQAQQTTFILLRHAEKVQDGSKDPALTAEGMKRAIRLKEMLKDQDIAAAYSSPYVRTKSTVQPTAEAHDLTVVEYKSMQEGFLKALLEKHSGETVIIAGHSNTIPQLVNELIGEEKYDNLSEDEYGTLYIVTVTGYGEGKEVVIEY